MAEPLLNDCEWRTPLQCERGERVSQQMWMDVPADPCRQTGLLDSFPDHPLPHVAGGGPGRTFDDDEILWRPVRRSVVEQDPDKIRDARDGPTQVALGLLDRVRAAVDVDRPTNADVWDGGVEVVMVLLALTVWMFRSSEPSPTPPATNTAMHLVATPTADRPETSMQVQDFQPPPQEQVAPPARVTEDKPEPAATVNEPAASQTTNDENRASKQEKRRARKAAKRAFEKDLRRALQTCAVPPQTLHYVVTPTDLQLTGPEISKRQKCIEKFRKPAKGRFSGMIEYRGAGT